MGRIFFLIGINLECLKTYAFYTENGEIKRFFSGEELLYGVTHVLPKWWKHDILEFKNLKLYLNS